MKTQVQFDTYPVNTELDPSGGYFMRLKELQMVNDSSVFEEVVKEMTLPISAELLEFSFRCVLKTMSIRVSKDCRPRKIGTYLKCSPYLRGKLASPYSAYDPDTCSCAIVFTSLSGVEKTVNTTDYVQFVNARTGTKVKIDRITYEGSTALVDVIKKDLGIVVTGLNCQWLEGDSCTLAWTDAQGAAHTASITPASSSVTEMKFNWPTALDSVAAGTEILFHFLTRGGIEESEPQPNDKTVTLIADESEVPKVDRIYSADHTGDVGKVWQNKNLMIEGSNLKLDANTYVQFDGLKNGAAVAGAFRMSAALTNANTFLELDYTGCEGDAFSFDNGSEITFKVKGVTAKATFTTGA